MTGDLFIKLGFWSQLVFLALVDWGTLVAFSNQPPPWYHWAGFVVVNLLCLTATVFVWRWLRHQTDPQAVPRSHGPG
ncbi:MAG: hypothetical protein QGG40_18965 [Myxococcota bacterium]|nr:hypothetical protein [Myxococcota bacterium]